MHLQDLERNRKLGAREVMVTVDNWHSVEATNVGSLILD
ncbi:hypothetical protein OROMI_008808 [Orobanche minor]